MEGWISDWMANKNNTLSEGNNRGITQSPVNKCFKYSECLLIATFILQYIIKG